jgi:lysophospholipase L1-like esterase
VAVQGLLDQDPTLSGLDPVVLDQGKPMEFISREETWTRWLNALDFHDPDLVILLEATNDVRDPVAIPMADIRQGLIRMVDEAMGRGLDLILCSLLPRVGDCGDVESPTTAEYNAWLVPYAAGRGVPLVDLYQEFLSTPDWEHEFFDAGDCLHPNAKGRTRIGELLTEKIQELY